MKLTFLALTIALSSFSSYAGQIALEYKGSTRVSRETSKDSLHEIEMDIVRYLKRDLYCSYAAVKAEITEEGTIWDDYRVRIDALCERVKEIKLKKSDFRLNLKVRLNSLDTEGESFYLPL